MPHPKRSFVTILLIACIFLLFYHALQASPALSDSSCQVCDQVDWSRFAYAQYATTPSHLCNSVMLFERLHSLQSKADRLLMYPAQSSPNGRGIYGTLLRKARDQYGAKLKPIDVQRRRGDDRKSSETSNILLSLPRLTNSLEQPGPKAIPSSSLSTRPNTIASSISTRTRPSYNTWTSSSSYHHPPPQCAGPTGKRNRS